MYMSIQAYPEIKALPSDQRSGVIKEFLAAHPKAKKLQMYVMLAALPFIIGGVVILNVAGLGGAVGGAIGGGVGGAVGWMACGPFAYNGPIRKEFELFWQQRSA